MDGPNQGEAGLNFSFLFGGGNNDNSLAINAIFALQLKCEDFTQIDVFTTYTKILIDVLERTHGLPQKYDQYLWDNHLQSESSKGLVSMLSRAMADKKDLFLVFKQSSGVLRMATSDEEQLIRQEYKERSESKTGVWISFEHYTRTDMLKIYSNFEYYVLAGLNKSLNVSKALQFKISGLRAGVSLADSAVAKSQGSELAKALERGNDIMVDKEDEISTTTPDVSPAEKSMTFIDGKKAFYLNMPLSYLSGQQTTGIGSTGEADMRAVERGLKQFFSSIVRPVLKALFGVDVEFKSQDFRHITSGMEALKTFGLTNGDGFLSQESMIRIVCKLFDLDYDKEKASLESEGKDQDDPGKGPAEDSMLPPGRSELEREVET